MALGTNHTGMQSARIKTITPDAASAYFRRLQKDFAGGEKAPPVQFLKVVTTGREIELVAPPTVAANYGMVGGTPHIFIANFTGLVPSKVAVAAAVHNIRVRVPEAQGKVLTFLPFLGEARMVRGEKQGDKVEFLLPPVERGAVVWLGGSE